VAGLIVSDRADRPAGSDSSGFAEFGIGQALTHLPHHTFLPALYSTPSAVHTVHIKHAQ
jgi:hypothetical protein